MPSDHFFVGNTSFRNDQQVKLQIWEIVALIPVTKWATRHHHIDNPVLRSTADMRCEQETSPAEVQGLILSIC